MSTHEDSRALLLTPRELGRQLRISRRAVYLAVQRNQLPGVVRIGRRLRFDAAVVRRWLDDLRQQGASPAGSAEPRAGPGQSALHDGG